MALTIPEGVWVLSGVSRLVGVEDHSPVSGALEQTGDRLVDEFLRTVEDRWQGQAYQGFESYLTEGKGSVNPWEGMVEARPVVAVG